MGLERLFWSFLENAIYCRPIIFKIDKTVKAKERLDNCSRLKEANEAWKLNVKHDPGFSFAVKVTIGKIDEV